MASPDINTEDFMAAVDFLSLNDRVDPDRIGIIGICGWGGMAINTAALDTRIKATVASTMYDMTRVNAKGYFDSEDSEEARYEKKKAMCAQRLEDLKSGDYKLGGGVVDPLPSDAPFFVKEVIISLAVELSIRCLRMHLSLLRITIAITRPIVDIMQEALTLMVVGM